jgi:hypothetical protein
MFNNSKWTCPNCEVLFYIGTFFRRIITASPSITELLTGCRTILLPSQKHGWGMFALTTIHRDGKHFWYIWCWIFENCRVEFSLSEIIVTARGELLSTEEITEKYGSRDPEKCVFKIRVSTLLLIAASYRYENFEGPDGKLFCTLAPKWEHQPANFLNNAHRGAVCQL